MSYAYTSPKKSYVGPQPSVNIGTLGHVDNGKSTLIQALTGVWTGRHSEELRRGITIKVGYAETAFYKCQECGTFGTNEICSSCGSSCKFLRSISFVDCPGHHSLMITMLSGAALMDGALLILSAADKTPQPQDREHLAASEIIGIKKMVIVQNKIDIVSQERAIESYNEINAFVKGKIAENCPIIPISAQHGVNIDALIQAIEKQIPTPKRDLTKSPLMYVVRSFDVNKPGTDAEEIAGGVIGGSVLQGIFEVDQEVEILPGIGIKKEGKIKYEPIYTKITSLHTGGQFVDKVICGGLIGMGTLLDPSITRADGLVGNVIGKPGKLPPVLEKINIEASLFEKTMGTQELSEVEKIKLNEPLVLNMGTTVTSGIPISVKRNRVEISLRRPVCIQPKSRIAISRRISDNWRLIGYGVLQ